MNVVWAILSGTPWWAFALLAVLLGVGIQQLRPRAVPVSRIALVPAMFLAWGLIALWTRATMAAGIVPAWLVALIVGACLGWATTRVDGLRADPRHGLIHLPGSWTILVASSAVFAAKYALAVSAAMNPEWRAATAVADVAVSGLGAGYFLARLARTLRFYRNSPSANLACDGAPLASARRTSGAELADAGKAG
jgi:hypothetical protein